MAAVAGLLREELMALFGAEMRNVYDGSGVGCNEPQNVAGVEAFQALAGFQHGKRAQKPHRIEVMVGHAAHYSEPRFDLLCRCA